MSTAQHINGSGKSSKKAPIDIKSRATKSTKKTENVSSEQVILDQQETMYQKMHRMVREHAEELGIKMPGWKRKLIAYAGAFLIGYGMGSLFAYIDVMLLSSIASTSIFLYWVAYVLGLAVTIYAAVRISQKFGAYVITGDIDRDIVRAKNWVTGLFKSEPKTQPV